MKIVLDLSKLVEEGKLTLAEAERLKLLAASDTGSLGINILVGFGVISVALGLGALVQDVAAGFVIGGTLFALGAYLIHARMKQWWLLAQIFTVLGALMFCASLLIFRESTVWSMLTVAVLLAAAGVLARSGLLVALSVLAFGACLGAQAGYWHATYALAIYEPLLTIVLFSGLALGTYWLSYRLPAAYERLALMASRTSVLMVNFGFWIGSLWGDRLLLMRGLTRSAQPDVIVQDWVFGIGWALALIAVGAWGVKANRRWVVNIAAVFGAIHSIRNGSSGSARRRCRCWRSAPVSAPRPATGTPRTRWRSTSRCSPSCCSPGSPSRLISSR
jgi:hypothetical protein